MNQGERIDRIGFGNLQLIQKPEEFCYGVDAVILADFVKAKSGDCIMDLGTGTGIIPFILSHKTKAYRIYGLEVQEDSYRRACRNVELNGLNHRVQILNGNVKHIKNAALPPFQVVVTNPPYMKGGGGLKNANEAKTIARHETMASLEDFIACAQRLLVDKGHFYMVHRPSRLVDICYLCRTYGLEPKEIRFVSPNVKKPPNIILIHCVKNGGCEVKVLEPLYVYEETGAYSQEILRIYEK
ncbi:MAG: tRNA1(Val) (adenine(37)-N6)-methyltransferase [Anaerovorax sp.]